MAIAKVTNPAPPGGTPYAKAPAAAKKPAAVGYQGNPLIPGAGHLIVPAPPPAQRSPASVTPDAAPGAGSAPPLQAQTDPNTQQDPSAFLGQFGINDPTVQKMIQDMISSGSSAAQIVGALRGTQWYQDMYPGIFQGIAKGLLDPNNPEIQYRAQLNQVNQLYSQYYGRNVTGGEFSTYLGNGIDVSTIAKKLQGEANASVLGKANVASLFSKEDLNAIGMSQAGLGNANSDYLAQLYQYGQGVKNAYDQYGQSLDRAGLEGLYGSGRTVTQVGQHLAGQSYIGANQNQLQYLSGAFGDSGQLTTDQLSAYGDQQAGLQTPLGDLIAQRLQSAQQRFARVFQGTLASPSLSNAGGRLIGNQQPPDTGS
jgi:hypothetical protein